MKKLHEVRVDFVYYAYTETEEQALRCAEDAIFDSWISDNALVREIEFKDALIDSGWDNESLVYGPVKDVTLGSLLDQLPAKGEC